MDNNLKGFQLTTEKKILFLISYLLVVIVLFFIFAEVILRFNGVKPWQQDNIAIQVTPGGRLFTKHPSLGYTHIPGKFTVTLNDGYSFIVNHLPNTLRVTHALNTYVEEENKREIWIFGCSFTHGWALNDQETYPWLLQERFPKYEVVNFGVSGYGTMHSLIQFREALRLGKVPQTVVLTYASFHDERNVFSRNRRKEVAPWNKLGPLNQPYALLNQNGTLNYYLADVEYREFPLMTYSALMHFIEIIYNKFENWRYRSQQVSKELILEFARTAKKNKINFVVAGIWSDSQKSNLLSFIKEEGIMVVDISVDLNNKENTNLPHDEHPNALANKKYADKLEETLRMEVLNN
jgi:hypothetical protein